MRQLAMWGAVILLSAGFLAYEQPFSSAAVQGSGPAAIVAGDGYGVSECLTSGDACGSLVAEGWCKANGFNRLVSYRKASREDITGASGTLITDEKSGESVVIDCGA